MTRIVSWLLGTVTAVTLLFAYHTSTSGPATASDTVAEAPATPGSATSTTVTGSAASTRWGDVQVAITVTDGRITAVDVPEYPTGNGKDREINAEALPILTKETLAAQSADIDMVSGATVTSEGYVRSLQSAIDKAGL